MTKIFWNDQRKELPVLSKCAEIILNMPASSAPIENCFSKINHLFQDHRRSLKAGTLLSLVQQRSHTEFVDIVKNILVESQQNSSESSLNNSGSLFE